MRPALSRYADVLEASQQPLLYSSAECTTIEPLDTKALLPMMIFMDPPEHDVQRKLVSRAFTPRAISEFEPFVRKTTVDCLEPLRANGGGDFVEAFSAVLPMNVIMELLDIPSNTPVSRRGEGRRSGQSFSQACRPAHRLASPLLVETREAGVWLGQEEPARGSSPVWWSRQVQRRLTQEEIDRLVGRLRGGCDHRCARRAVRDP